MTSLAACGVRYDVIPVPTDRPIVEAVALEQISPGRPREARMTVRRDSSSESVSGMQTSGEALEALAARTGFSVPGAESNDSTNG